MNIDLLPLIIYGGIVLFIVAAMLGGSLLLGQKRATQATNEPFESGIIGQGDANFRVSVHFYLTAILFIIFDLEAVFLFAWAISIREAGWLGFVEVAIFITILVAGLAYLWRSGALEWRTERQIGKRQAVLNEGGGVVNIVNHQKRQEVAAPVDTHHHAGGH